MDRTFHWSETRDVLRELTAVAPLRREDRTFVGGGVRLHPPLVLPIDASVQSGADYLVALPEELGRHLVVLLQAGAAALGMFDGGESTHTKSLKKYVVRGRGKAQPTHLSTKGKSRYGSRLRLQNARNLLIEVNEKLHEWVDADGASDLVFCSCPVRIYPELFRTKPAPPFERETAIRIPYDVPVPTTEVLLRTYRRMSYGRVESAESTAP